MELTSSLPLRDIPDKELEETLQAHRRWLESSGKEGRQADLSQTNLKGRYLSEANLFNANLLGSDFTGANLTHIRLEEANLASAILIQASLYQANLIRSNLVGSDLAKAVLSGANCQDADLAGANLQQANLSTSDLSGVHLRDANLEGADLTEAKLHDAQLLRTNLRNADLQDADLATAKCLMSSQLAGSNVSGAKLPESIGKFEGLGQVKQLSESAKKLFISILLGCVYCWLTIAATTDARLLTNSSSSPLPIIQTPIPIAGFYGVMPFILLALFVYFHLYLQRLWRELSGLPAVFPDGKPLHEKAHPWLLNSLVCAHVEKLKDNRPALSRLETGLSILLAWWVVPLTNMLFWLRSLQRHDWVLTSLQLIWTVSSIVIAVMFYRLTRETLSGIKPAAIHFKLNWANATAYKEVVRRFGKTVGIGAISSLLLLVISDGAINAKWVLRDLSDVVSLFKIVPIDRKDFHRVYIPNLLPLIGARAIADLREQEVSTKPSNLLVRDDQELLRIVRGAQLRRADLRLANAERAFLVNADLRNASLQGAYFIEANLHGADLSGSVLLKGDLFRANLQDARLVGANLREANMTIANLKGANLSGSNLQEAQLSSANMEGAILTDSKMQGADLTGAKLQGANLIGVLLNGAVLFAADLENAELVGADLRGADLAGANMRGTDLQDALIEGARMSRKISEMEGFVKVQLEGANLRLVKGLTQEQINQTCVDKKTRLPPNLKRPKPCQYHK